tara:strand:+ start:3439 stop:3678 length:240 start_codon:yes stop_codon:yes gene_type:complete
MLSCERCGEEFDLDDEVFILTGGRYGISPRTGHGTLVDEEEPTHYHGRCLIYTVMESEPAQEILQGFTEEIQEDVLRAL